MFLSFIVTFNCTTLELKHRLCISDHCRLQTFNCTTLELKHPADW